MKYFLYYDESISALYKVPPKSQKFKCEQCDGQFFYSFFVGPILRIRSDGQSRLKYGTADEKRRGWARIQRQKPLSQTTKSDLTHSHNTNPVTGPGLGEGNLAGRLTGQPSIPGTRDGPDRRAAHNCNRAYRTWQKLFRASVILKESADIVPEWGWSRESENVSWLLSCWNCSCHTVWPSWLYCSK